MCGLVGVVGNIWPQEKKAFRNLLELDAYRGPHSTGVAVINKKNEITIKKAVGRTWKLYAENPDFFDDEELIKQYEVKALIGHNRFATTGGKTEANAHPFLHGEVVGAHNGTLDKPHLHRIDGHDKFEVDSEALIYSFNKNGWKETLENTKGAWALTWYDRRDDRMHFIRNTERPLFWCFNNTTDSFFWASEEWMLEMALDQARIKTQRIQMFDPYQHHYLDLKDGGNIKSKKLMYETKEVRGYVPAPFVQASFKHMGGAPTEGINPFRETPSQQGQPTSIQTTEHKPTTNSGETKKTAIFDRKTTTLDDVVDNVTKGLVGKRIQFQIFGERIPKDGMKYNLCDSPSVNPIYEIRIYSENHARHDEWRDSQGYYNARVKSAVCNWSGSKWVRYITIDMRTVSDNYHIPMSLKEIRELDTPVVTKTDVVIIQDKKITEDKTTIITEDHLKWDPNRDYKGYKDQHLTFSQFMQATKRGCSECGQEITALEVDKIVWVGRWSFVCPICDNRMRTEIAMKKHNIK